MTPSLSRPAFGLGLVFAVGLVALPACNKDKGGDTGPGGPPADYKGSKGGPPGGPPGQPGTNPPQAATPGGALIKTSDTRAMTESKNNLKQIAIAFHSTFDTYGQFPVGIAGPDGKPGLSWRVALLPFLEQLDLYKEFKLNEPWDSEHNKKLIAKMPKVYAAPGGDTTRGMTFYRGFSGNGAVLTPAQPGKPGDPVFAQFKLNTIPDGTSNTLLVAEAGEAVIWTKPDEVAFDPKKPPKLGGIFEGGFHVAFCDGSIRFIHGNVPPATLANLIQANDGNVIGEIP